jgi:hypothetical protein
VVTYATRHVSEARIYVLRQRRKVSNKNFHPKTRRRRHELVSCGWVVDVSAIIVGHRANIVESLWRDCRYPDVLCATQSGEAIAGHPKTPWDC